MTPYSRIPPKVYILVTHTKNKVFGVYLKQNSSENYCVWCNQRLKKQAYKSAFVKY